MPRRRTPSVPTSAAVHSGDAAPAAQHAASEHRHAQLRRSAQDRVSRLEQGRRTGLFVAVGKRFGAIDGSTYGGLMAIELFTTVLPLIILGFGYFSGFASDASVGNLFVRQLGLTGTSEQTVRAAFGTSKALQSSWTVAGLAGWLIWGIPMAITVTGMFAKAWRRKQFTLLQRLGRGSAWFVLYLTMLIVRERIAFGESHELAARIAFFGVPAPSVAVLDTDAGAISTRRGAWEEIPGRSWIGRAGDRWRNTRAWHTHRLSTPTQRLDDFRSNRCRDGRHDLVRRARLRMGHYRVLQRRPMGAICTDPDRRSRSVRNVTKELRRRAAHAHSR